MFGISSSLSFLTQFSGVISSSRKQCGVRLVTSKLNNFHFPRNCVCVSWLFQPRPLAISQYVETVATRCSVSSSPIIIEGRRTLLPSVTSQLILLVSRYRSLTSLRVTFRCRWLSIAHVQMYVTLICGFLLLPLDS
jgi:hypothetical protein